MLPKGLECRSHLNDARGRRCSSRRTWSYSKKNVMNCGVFVSFQEIDINVRVFTLLGDELDPCVCPYGVSFPGLQSLFNMHAPRIVQIKGKCAPAAGDVG